MSTNSFQIDANIGQGSLVGGEITTYDMHCIVTSSGVGNGLGPFVSKEIMGHGGYCGTNFNGSHVGVAINAHDMCFHPTSSRAHLHNNQGPQVGGEIMTQGGYGDTNGVGLLHIQGSGLGEGIMTSNSHINSNFAMGFRHGRGHQSTSMFANHVGNNVVSRNMELSVSSKRRHKSHALEIIRKQRFEDEKQAQEKARIERIKQLTNNIEEIRKQRAQKGLPQQFVPPADKIWKPRMQDGLQGVFQMTVQMLWTTLSNCLLLRVEKERKT